MDFLLDLFRIDTVFFTVFDYPMSYIECIGTVFNLWCVVLATKNNVLTWPIGIGGILLFMALFYQIQLYSDFFEQGYFLVMSFWGWWMWGKKKTGDAGEVLQISNLTISQIQRWVLGIVLSVTVLWQVGSHIHLWVPALFSIPAQFPFLDAATTVLSVCAMVLMGQKKIECWWLWIVVDVLGIGIYYASGVPFVALLYAVFLVLAVSGLRSWEKETAAYVSAAKI